MKNMFLYKGTDFKIRLYFLFLNGEKQELLLEEDTIQIGEKNPYETENSVQILWENFNHSENYTNKTV